MAASCRDQEHCPLPLGGCTAPWLWGNAEGSLELGAVAMAQSVAPAGGWFAAGLLAGNLWVSNLLQRPAWLGEGKCPPKGEMQ